jgi:hypothetical protein
VFGFNFGCNRFERIERCEFEPLSLDFGGSPNGGYDSWDDHDGLSSPSEGGSNGDHFFKSGFDDKS